LPQGYRATDGGAAAGPGTEQLTLNEAKTQVLKAYLGKLGFWGVEICMEKGRGKSNWYLRVKPLRRSLLFIRRVKAC